MSADTPPTISPATASSAAESIRLALGDAREVDRFHQARPAAVDELPCDGLLEARRDNQRVGVVLSVTQPGRIGQLWPPRLVEGEPTCTAEQLLEAAERRMAADRLTMAYVALPSIDPSDDRLLTANGYAATAGVLYLVSDVRDFVASRPSGPLTFAPYDEADRARLAQAVESTYEQTRDCPLLEGLRNVEDVLGGYRETGRFDPRHWLVARHHGEDVGCLIVTDHEDHDCCELVYMGLAVSARGHGWGRHLARHAQWLTARAGREQLVVAVDAENEPAINAYTSVGFRVWDRRAVYVKTLAHDDG